MQLANDAIPVEAGGYARIMLTGSSSPPPHGNIAGAIAINGFILLVIAGTKLLLDLDSSPRVQQSTRTNGTMKLASVLLSFTLFTITMGLAVPRDFPDFASTFTATAQALLITV